MRVRREIAHRHVSVGGPLDTPGTEQAVGVAVNQQREHRVGRILLVAAAFVVNGQGGQRQPLDGLNDKVDQIIFGHPVAQVGGQQQRGVAVGVLKTMSHDGIMDDTGHAAVLSTENFPRKKSDTLLIHRTPSRRRQFSVFGFVAVRFQLRDPQWELLAANTRRRF